MKKLLLTSMTSVILFAFQANAQETQKTADFKPYVSAKAVYSFTNSEFWVDGEEDFDNIGLNLAIGTQIDKNFRAELEFGYRGKDDISASYVDYDSSYDYIGNEKLEVSMTSYMLNGYYDFHNKTKITPYLGAGLGVAKVKYKYSYAHDVYTYPAGVYVGTLGDSLTASKTKFAWNVGLGAAYEINDKLAIDFGFRYIDYGTVSDSDGDDYETTAKEVSLGIRYSF